MQDATKFAYKITDICPKHKGFIFYLVDAAGV